MWRKKDKIKLLLLPVCLFCVLKTTAQNDTQHPYSMFGLGELENRNYGSYSGMSGAGIGVAPDNSINTMNPASLTSLENQQLYMEISMGLQQSTFREGKTSNTVLNGNLKKLAIGLKVKDFWAVAASLTPYSKVGYFINTESPIEGSGGYTIGQFEGSGGLSRIGLSNSFSLFDRIHLGVNAYYLSGNIYKTETQTTLSVEDRMYVSKVNYDLGLQFTGKFKEEGWSYNLGGIWRPGFDVKISNTQEISGVEASHSTIRTSIPPLYGGGFGLTKTNRYSQWMVAADYLEQNWKDVSFQNTTFNKYRQANAGLQFIPNARERKYTLRNWHYQIGGKASESYILMGGKPVRDYSVSIGAVIPSRNNFFIYFSAEYGKKQTDYVYGIDEDYFMFTLGVTFLEKLYGKAKFR